ncbi:MAG: hypothetical protein M1839_005880 [Geoglossum umbratile]|nr:MAG: hypothetical protein M1839_005880 [Geoglossum umbratile]
MDPVCGLAYDTWTTALSKLDRGSDGTISASRGHSTPSFSSDSSDSPSFGVNPTPTSPGPHRHTSSTDIHRRTWPASSGGGALLRSNAPQSFGDIDWGNVFQLNEFGGGVSPSEVTHKQHQFSMPSVELPHFQAGRTWAAVTQAADLALLPTAKATVGPFVNEGSYEPGGPTANPFTQQRVYMSSSDLQNQQLPPNACDVIRPTNRRDFQQTQGIAFPGNPSAGRGIPYSSPEPVFGRGGRKRSLPLETTPPTSLMGQEDDGGKKKIHNGVEKRYRQNLNARIAALRDSVPALRAMSQGGQGRDGENGDPEGPTTAHALNKATVLLGATEYIKQLEKRNSQLVDKCEIQKARLDAIGKLYAAGKITDLPNSQNSFSISDLGGAGRQTEHPRTCSFGSVGGRQSCGSTDFCFTEEDRVRGKG